MRNPLNRKLLKEVKTRKMIAGKSLELYEIISRRDGITTREVIKIYNTKHKDNPINPSAASGRIAEMCKRQFLAVSEVVKNRRGKTAYKWVIANELPRRPRPGRKPGFLVKKLEERAFETNTAPQETYLDVQSGVEASEVTALAAPQKTVWQTLVTLVKGLLGLK